MHLQQDVLVFVLGLTELTRRCIWNVLRLEFEQYHNTGEACRAGRSRSVKCNHVLRILNSESRSKYLLTAGEWRAVKDVSLELSESMLLSHRVASISRRTFVLRVAHAAHSLRRSLRRLFSGLAVRSADHRTPTGSAKGSRAEGGPGRAQAGAAGRQLRVRRAQVAAARFLSKAPGPSSLSSRAEANVQDGHAAGAAAGRVATRRLLVHAARRAGNSSGQEPEAAPATLEEGESRPDGAVRDCDFPPDTAADPTTGQTCSPAGFGRDVYSTPDPDDSDKVVFFRQPLSPM